jgi:ATP-dependent NAD(P)H-hydrate dehydratase
LCSKLAAALQNVTIIQKGSEDIISNGLPISAPLLGEGEKDTDALVSNVQGGLKRVGGQGDILSGSTGVLMAWGTEWIKGTYE